MNTAVRISFAMAQDDEMPSLLGTLHEKHATPHMGVWMLVAVSAIIGSVGVLSVTALTGVTLASNIGTFILYALICVFTFVTFVGRSEFHSIKHAVIPFLGLIGTPGVSQDATQMALWITIGWGILSVGYLIYNSKKNGRHILPSAGGVIKS